VTIDAYLVGQGLAITVALVAAVFDARSGSIPNWVSLPVIALAAVGYGVFGGWMAAGLSFAGAALCALLPFLLHRAGAMGGGDVKIFAAIGSLLGPGPGLEAEVFALLFAIILGVVALARAGELRTGARRAAGLLWRRPETKEDVEHRPVRLGVAVLLGTALAVAAIHL
jgi:prepilin peptidase CpaA